MNNGTYHPPFYLRNGHFQTIYPTLYRRVNHRPYTRERIHTPDDDFLDLDWACVGSNTLVIVSHGLEGNSHRTYVTGMVKSVNDFGMDALAWNFRSCSGETNRQLIMYHNGATYDLDTVIKHAVATGRYSHIYLVGFSMGGNLSLLYAGEKADQIDPHVKGVVGFSVPCDLKDSATTLSKPVNKIYMKRFLKMLHKKVKAKQLLYPNDISDNHYDQLKNFEDFDGRYTAPLHGFESAQDYWTKCSSNRTLTDIEIPALIVNALDDPFLTGSCYPHTIAAQNTHVTLETPQYGGHVGFIQTGARYWSENRVIQFIFRSSNKNRTQN